MTGVAYENLIASSETIDTTEWSLANDATFSAGINNPGRFSARILVPAAAVPADTFQLAVYYVINAQTIQQDWTRIIKGTSALQSVTVDGIENAENWDITLKKLTGTARAFHFAISEQSSATATVTTVPNTISVDAGGTLTIGATGATVVNTGTVAATVADKTSYSLSAAGVTSVQAGLALSTQVDTLEGLLPGTITTAAGGTLTIGANGATVIKTGYPTNFSTLLIGAGGTVTTTAGGVAADVNVLTWGGNTVTAASAGRIEVDMVDLAGNTTAANNLRNMFDGSGYVDPFAPAMQGQIPGTFGMGAGGSVVINGGGLLALEATAQSIKLKTDNLVFTVAGVVNAGIYYVNGIQIDGDGQDATPWGPV